MIRTHHNSLHTAHRRTATSDVWLYCVALLPILGLYGYVLWHYRQTYLLRRDENIMLAMVELLRAGYAPSDIFTMVIPTHFLAGLQWVTQFVDPLMFGRTLGVISALAVLALCARIARSTLR